MTDRWPDLDAVSLLAAVVETGSIGSAAQRMGMTQPGASRALSTLERRVGLPLLERHPTGSRATAEGALYLDWARPVLESAQRLQVASQALRARHSSQLRVAASMTIAEHLAPGWLADLHRSHPGLDIDLDVDNSDSVLERVREGAVDVGFIETTGHIPRGLRGTVVGRDRLLVVTAPSHRWARRRRPLSAQELAETPLVVREPGSGTRLAFEHAVRSQGLEPVAPVQALTSNAAVRVAASAGMAPAVLSEHAVRDAVASGQLVVVPVDLDLGRELRAAWRSGTRPAGAAAELVSIARRGGGRGRPVTEPERSQMAGVLRRA